MGHYQATSGPLIGPLGGPLIGLLHHIIKDYMPYVQIYSPAPRTPLPDPPVERHCLDALQTST